MSHEHNYALVLSFEGLFPTLPEEVAFVLGVEFGQIYGRMHIGGESKIEEATHTENREVIQRAAAAKGWEIEVTPSGTPGWDMTRLVKAAEPTRPNPLGLRVVEREVPHAQLD